jgi:hypothetical protein
MKLTCLSSVVTCLALVSPAFGEDAQPPAPAPPAPAAKETAAKPAEAKVAEAKPDEDPPEDPVAKHHAGSTKVADDQDELSADVQQITIEQTIPKVIELFQEVEGIMDEATDWLTEYDTGGRTMAAQTEVVEKIFEATKERQKQQSGGQASGAMMDMMEKMMEEGEGKEGEPKKGKKPGDKPGQGQTGDSDAANEATGAAGDGKNEARRVPKAAGTTGAPLPEEFRKALDAYNRGLERKEK